MAQTKCLIKHTRENRSRKNDYKDGKALQKLTNNAVYGKTMQNLRNRIDAELVKNEKDQLKWPSKLCHRICWDEHIRIELSINV